MIRFELREKMTLVVLLHTSNIIGMITITIPIKFCSDPFPCLPTSVVDMENPFHIATKCTSDGASMKWLAIPTAWDMS